MTDQQQQLLDRLMASPYFAHASSLRRILQLLCARTSDPESPALKEYEIAIDALARPPSFDPKTDPIVRVSISAIRDRLRSYFAEHGAQEEWNLSIPKGEYRAVFSGATPWETAEPSGQPGLRRFWSPYASRSASNILLYTDVLFFQDYQGNYFRNIFLNDPAAKPE